MCNDIDSRYPGGYPRYPGGYLIAAFEAPHGIYTCDVSLEIRAEDILVIDVLTISGLKMTVCSGPVPCSQQILTQPSRIEVKGLATLSVSRSSAGRKARWITVKYEGIYKYRQIPVTSLALYMYASL